MRKCLAQFIPDAAKFYLKKLYYLPLDFFDRLKDPNSMVPPRSMVFVGSGDFLEIGERFKTYFLELANLQPSDRVLDVGSGIGRMAIPLTNYLAQNGEYWGFDIVQKGVKWCQNRISTKFDNFHFIHADIYNKNYNQNGKIRSKDFKFPFQNEFFNFVFATSVFTHMLPTDVEHYVSEISRVIEHNGKCLLTFFLLNSESKNLILSGRSSINFKYKVGGCLTANENIPEAAIAYDEELIFGLLEKYRFSIVRPIHYGSWCKRENVLSYQDIVIATKDNSF